MFLRHLRFSPLLIFVLSACTPAPTTQPTIVPPSVTPTPMPLTATPTATITPTSTTTPLTCWDDGGEMEITQLESDLLPQPLAFRIYTPPCYAAQSQRDYPVLYLIHGQTFNDDQWDRLGADEMVSDLVARGEIEPFIIVMPRDRVWRQPDEDNFGQAIINDLIPYIDDNYRTLDLRQYRAVGGLSRGAAWAVHLGLSQWEYFGTIGGHSLPVFWTDGYQIDDWLLEIPESQLPRIWVDVGDRDQQAILQSSIWFHELLEGMDIPHEWHLNEGRHEEAYWIAHLEEYIRWYAQGFAAR
ncbi:MAG: hypothetical protein DWQ07_10265 [Chloroflexi bacterium]|nr:MAG: hypothetical protein DWQ07_10265 [Chloroflexota bacterium]MBL1192905.1 hypothetical protein [Chloroflexota bacterium]NOH10197.1 hypothetical protein [Chloroflexota bacterium]